MAVLDDVPEIAVAIVVDGQRLEEYVDPDAAAESRVTERYIEASSNKQFAIAIKFNKVVELHGDGLCISVVLDGVYSTGGFISKEKMVAGRIYPIMGRLISADQIQYILFLRTGDR